MSRFVTMLADVEITRAKDVKKHGEHDQSSHGAWATGGGDSTSEGSNNKGVGYQETDKHPQYNFNSIEGVDVEYYTSEGAWKVNELLRTNKTDEDRDELRGIIKSLDKEIKKTSAPRDMTLYRGISGVSQFENLREGDTFVDKAFVSTSSDVGVVWDFMSTATGGQFDSRPVEKGYVLEISVPKGNQVLSVSNYFNNVGEKYGPSDSIRAEKEHILPRGTKFRVDSIGTIDVRGGIKDKLIKVSVVKDEK